jgi:polar amino acid transport system permease protein
VNFSWSYAWSILPALLRGAEVTLFATLGGMAFALAFGLAVAAAQFTGTTPRLLARSYMQFMRNTPLLVQLYYFYYILPAFGLRMSALATGILALGLNYGAYISEVYRAGLEAVPEGQWTAAAAIGMRPITAWRRVILPQALRRVMPVLGNYAIAMFKDTPLLMTISVVELVAAAKSAGDASYRYLEPFTIAGAIFLILSYPAGLGVRRFERWSRAHE